MIPRTAKVTIDPAALRPTEVLTQIGTDVPLIIVGAAMLQALINGLGNTRRAFRFLSRLAERRGKPVAVNLETGDGTSSTVVLSPPFWSPERLAGYVGGLSQELERLFGPGVLREAAL
jgi:hypothetical protein